MKMLINRLHPCIRLLRLRRLIKKKMVLNTMREIEVDFSKEYLISLIDAIEYVPWFELRKMISFEVLKLLDEIEQPSFAELRLAAQDESGVLGVYMVVNFKFDIPTTHRMIGAPEERLRLMGKAIAIQNRYLSAILPNDDDALYIYFKYDALADNELSTFGSKELQQKFLLKLVCDETVIFNKTVENVIKLMDNGYLDVEANASFFTTFFRDHSYLSELHFTMFCKAIRAFPSIFNNLLTVRLVIDPFNKQVKYEKWLEDAQKFMFLKQLRMRCLQGYESVILSEFDKKTSLFTELNRHEIILRKFFEEGRT